MAEFSLTSTAFANGGRFIHWLAWDMTPDTGGLGGGQRRDRSARE
jgi:hypothetical protein